MLSARCLESAVQRQLSSIRPTSMHFFLTMPLWRQQEHLRASSVVSRQVQVTARRLHDRQWRMDLASAFDARGWRQSDVIETMTSLRCCSSSSTCDKSLVGDAIYTQTQRSQISPATRCCVVYAGDDVDAMTVDDDDWTRLATRSASAYSAYTYSCARHGCDTTSSLRCRKRTSPCDVVRRRRRSGTAASWCATRPWWTRRTTAAGVSADTCPCTRSPPQVGSTCRNRRWCSASTWAVYTRSADQL